MIKKIVNGWKNYLVDDPVVDLIAKQRGEICSKCPEAKYGKFLAIMKDYKQHEIEGKYCGVCKCPLSAAVRSESKECPLGKW
ncbi:hypothetical protein [uncultured Christiangramia sp.]|uniref:hypothetical protein n=1 Tax=uncultured Christiangramia sp. TaxID=503836 RepID=UPI00260B21C4|nr:hypothetical protein [uncultured Christiangramia sp.]